MHWFTCLILQKSPNGSDGASMCSQACAIIHDVATACLSAYFDNFAGKAYPFSFSIVGFSLKVKNYGFPIFAVIEVIINIFVTFLLCVLMLITYVALLDYCDKLFSLAYKNTTTSQGHEQSFI